MAFKRILCAVDFSEYSVKAFQQAAELARLGAGELYLLHSIEAQPFVSDLPGVDEMGDTAVSLEERATAALESLVASSPISLEGIALSTEVTAGRAFAEILDHARDWSADLIVLGAKGAASLGQIVVGSTAEHVMKDAPCSLLIVKS